MFKLNFSTANSAFQDGNCGAQITAILWKVVHQIGSGETSGTVHDNNGNTVGSWSLDHEDVDHG